MSVSIKPLEDRILVHPLDAEQTTASGLVIPDTAKEKPQEGKVLAVGPGRFDEDGFLILFDRRKDMIISGGFNIYPSDLEGVLRGHAGVAESAVVGVPSEQWGETPVAYVVRKAGDGTSAKALLQWCNERVGRTQRLADLHFIEELPRSAIGKVLKRELRDRHLAGAAPTSA